MSGLIKRRPFDGRKRDYISHCLQSFHNKPIILISPVVRIFRFHRKDPGSIPGLGNSSFCHFHYILHLFASFCIFLHLFASFCIFLHLFASFCIFLHLFASFCIFLLSSALFSVAEQSPCESRAFDFLCRPIAKLVMLLIIVLGLSRLGCNKA
jgi:hypothetical protein